MRSEPETVTKEPHNAHTPPSALRERVTPQDAFYVRNHYAVPQIDPAKWRLKLPGATLNLAALRAAPQRTVEVVLECAGNGRTRMEPLPPGTPWGERAVGCARFTGAPLRDVIGQLPPGTKEILFVGADRDSTRAYERSLPLVRALHPDTLVAHAMNDEPLSPAHGAPARLIVPGWYGMASVKWLAEARALSTPFQGHFQADDYHYGPGQPVTSMRVKSLVTEPQEGARLRVGVPVVLHGFAWSGAGPIEAVDVSEDGGKSWQAAKLEAPASPYAWTPWHHAWTPRAKGHHELLSRARDATGDVQPAKPSWNERGYGNNEYGHVAVEVG